MYYGRYLLARWNTVFTVAMKTNFPGARRPSSMAEARVTGTYPWLQPPLRVDRLSILDPDPACCLLYAGSDGHGQRLCALGLLQGSSQGRPCVRAGDRDTVVPQHPLSGLSKGTD